MPIIFIRYTCAVLMSDMDPLVTLNLSNGVAVSQEVTQEGAWRADDFVGLDIEGINSKLYSGEMDPHGSTIEASNDGCVTWRTNLQP